MTGHEVVPVPRHARAFQGHPAGLATRGAAAVVDAVLIAILLLAGYLGLAGLRFVLNPRDFRFPDPTIWLGLSAYALALTLYLTWAWGGGGRTWGNTLMGLRVVHAHGGRVGWRRAGIRAITYLAFPIGLFWVALDRRSKSAQDRLLWTAVVYDWRPSVSVPDATGSRSSGWSEPWSVQAQLEEGDQDPDPSTGAGTRYPAAGVEPASGARSVAVEREKTDRHQQRDPGRGAQLRSP
jgi:uncharacterized RDD family membrane protein YckC